MSDSNANTEGRDPRICGACRHRRPTKQEANEYRWSGPGDICWSRDPACRDSLCRDLVEAARKLRRFMDGYFNEDRITEQAADVLGETAWID